MTRYRLAPLAESDLDEIWLYVAQDSGADAANRLIDDIAERLNLLATYPEAGRVREEIAANLRSFAIHSYVIYYQPDEAGVVIARILHGKRDHAATIEPSR